MTALFRDFLEWWWWLALVTGDKKANEARIFQFGHFKKAMF
jgi:hypothetical protein